MTDRVLDYVPALIAAYQAGHAGDHVHLGYWRGGVDTDWQAAQDAMTDLHLDALNMADGHTVIDVGCGLGGSLRHANARLKNARLVGLNIDARQLAVCQSHVARNGNTLDWMQGDAGAIPQPDCIADRVLSLEAMFHFSTRQQFLRDAARILRVGGRLVCSDVQYAAPQSAHHARLLDVVTKDYAPWPDPVIGVDAVVQMAQEAGLVAVHCTDISTNVLPTWDQITSPRDDPMTSPVAAMRDLHRAGLLHYQLMVFDKPV